MQLLLNFTAPTGCGYCCDDLFGGYKSLRFCLTYPLPTACWSVGHHYWQKWPHDFFADSTHYRTHHSMEYWYLLIIYIYNIHSKTICGVYFETMDIAYRCILCYRAARYLDTLASKRYIHLKITLFGAPARWSGAKSMTWTTLSRTESETDDAHGRCFYFE